MGAVLIGAGVVLAIVDVLLLAVVDMPMSGFIANGIVAGILIVAGNRVMRGEL